MKKIRAKDLRVKSKSELLKEVNTISKEMMKCKLLKAEGNNSNRHHVFSVMRKNVSRILTILSEKDEQKK